MRNKLIGLVSLAAFAGALLFVAFDVAQIHGQAAGKKGAGGKKGGAADPFADPTQQGGKGGKGGKKGGAGGAGFGGAGGGAGFGGGGNFNQTLNMDPDALFNLAAQGGDVIVIENTTSMRGQLQQFAAAMGNNTGVITREQFTGFFQNMMDNYNQGGIGALYGTKGAKGAQKGGKAFVDPNVRAEQLFRQYDTNNDDVLTESEMPSQLRTVYKQYDLDGNGMLTLDEFKLYFQATSAAEAQLLMNMSKNGKGPGLDPDDLDYRVQVYFRQVAQRIAHVVHPNGQGSRRPGWLIRVEG